ncbi:hypothetical protein, partial [Streptomyces sp. NPDC007856]|uniref:hypothetical protein n=1 Tax=Streptomyces sp. NPDC007856 TaxID=3364781 RepID=UPI00367E7BE5
MDVDEIILAPSDAARVHLGQVADMPWGGTAVEVAWRRSALPALSAGQMDALFETIDRQPPGTVTLGGVWDHIRTTHHDGDRYLKLSAEEIHRLHSIYLTDRDTAPAGNHTAGSGAGAKRRQHHSDEVMARALGEFFAADPHLGEG